jgi:hypothetical protein
MMDNSKLDSVNENAPMLFEQEDRDHTARAAKVEVVEINEQMSEPEEPEEDSMGDDE